MVEQVLADDRTMLAKQVRLPPPAARLALLGTAAAELGVDGDAGMRGVDLHRLASDAGGAAASDVALAPQIAVQALGHRLGGLGSFAELFAFDPNDFRPGGSVQRWARVLRTPGPSVRASPVRSGRLIACGAVAAWSEVAAIADAAERENARAVLREGLLRELTKDQQEALDGATRAAEPSAVSDSGHLGVEVIQLLLAGLDQLGGEFAQLKGAVGRIETGVSEITNATGIVQGHSGVTRLADSGASGDRTGWRVFISHTSELRAFPAGRSYVAAVERAISACGHVIVDMTDFPAADRLAAELCRERVRGCDVYVGVLGTRYGSPVRDKPKVSYTELEFETAAEAGLDRLMFLLDTDAVDVGIPPASLMDHKFGERQRRFAAGSGKAGLVTQSFTNPATLGQLVERSLRELAEMRRRGSGGARAGRAGSR